MNLAQLLEALPPTDLGALPFPRHLLGAFRRKSITFSTGETDETTVVYWFQSRTFTIDLRLPDAAATPVAHRQGWVGDTLWDEPARQLSWNVRASYQPRNQWPEPASFHFIGNSVIEFAPSGAYVEDWRQQSCAGPYLGLRLEGLLNEATGELVPLEGGLVLAGEHAAYAQSRHPSVQAALRDADDLQRALAEGIVTPADVESYEVSVAIGGSVVTHSTQPKRLGAAILEGDFALESGRQGDRRVTMRRIVDGAPCLLRFAVDVYLPEFSFDLRTPSTPDALDWMRREKDHLALHAVVLR